MDSLTTRRLNRQDYKTLALAALGGALEFYDFIIFVFFAAVIGELFFPPDIPEWLRQVQTFAIFAAGYLARPLGGIIMAHFGDKVGRKKMFSLRQHWHCRTVTDAADARAAGRGHWRRGAGRVGVCC